MQTAAGGIERGYWSKVKTEEGPNRAGIKEIASSLGISIGTVDRALHNRNGIRGDTRAKVLKMATSLNYKPNLVARRLKLNRQLRIGVHLPREIAAFFDPLREGIRAVAEGMAGVNVDLDFRTYPHIGFFQEPKKLAWGRLD